MLYKAAESDLRTYREMCDILQERINECAVNGSQSLIGDIRKELSEYKEKSAQALSTKEQIANSIDNIQDATYREILRRRYILCQTMEQIAVRMHKDYSYIVHTLHPNALKMYEESTEINSIQP